MDEQTIVEESITKIHATLVPSSTVSADSVQLHFSSDNSGADNDSVSALSQTSNTFTVVTTTETKTSSTSDDYFGSPGDANEPISISTTSVTTLLADDDQSKDPKTDQPGPADRKVKPKKGKKSDRAHSTDTDDSQSQPQTGEQISLITAVTVTELPSAEPSFILESTEQKIIDQYSLGTITYTEDSKPVVVERISGQDDESISSQTITITEEVSKPTFTEEVITTKKTSRKTKDKKSKEPSPVPSTDDGSSLRKGEPEVRSVEFSEKTVLNEQPIVEESITKIHATLVPSSTVSGDSVQLQFFSDKSGADNDSVSEVISASSRSSNTFTVVTTTETKTSSTSDNYFGSPDVANEPISISTTSVTAVLADDDRSKVPITDQPESAENKVQLNISNPPNSTGRDHVVTPEKRRVTVLSTNERHVVLEFGDQTSAQQPILDVIAGKELTSTIVPESISTVSEVLTPGNTVSVTSVSISTDNVRDRGHIHEQSDAMQYVHIHECSTPAVGQNVAGKAVTVVEEYVRSPVIYPDLSQGDSAEKQKLDQGYNQSSWCESGLRHQKIDDIFLSATKGTSEDGIAGSSFDVIGYSPLNVHTVGGRQRPTERQQIQQNPLTDTIPVMSQIYSDIQPDDRRFSYTLENSGSNQTNKRNHGDEAKLHGTQTSTSSLLEPDNRSQHIPTHATESKYSSTVMGWKHVPVLSAETASTHDFDLPVSFATSLADISSVQGGTSLQETNLAWDNDQSLNQHLLDELRNVSFELKPFGMISFEEAFCYVHDLELKKEARLLISFSDQSTSRRDRMISITLIERAIEICQFIEFINMSIPTYLEGKPHLRPYFYRSLQKKLIETEHWVNYIVSASHHKCKKDQEWKDVLGKWQYWYRKLQSSLTDQRPAQSEGSNIWKYYYDLFVVMVEIKDRDIQSLQAIDSNPDSQEEIDALQMSLVERRGKVNQLIVNRCIHSPLTPLVERIDRLANSNISDLVRTNQFLGSRISDIVERRENASTNDQMASTLSKWTEILDSNIIGKICAPNTSILTGIINETANMAGGQIVWEALNIHALSNVGPEKNRQYTNSQAELLDQFAQWNVYTSFWNNMAQELITERKWYDRTCTQLKELDATLSITEKQQGYKNLLINCMTHQAFIDGRISLFNDASRKMVIFDTWNEAMEQQQLTSTLKNTIEIATSDIEIYLSLSKHMNHDPQFSSKLELMSKNIDGALDNLKCSDFGSNEMMETFEPFWAIHEQIYQLELQLVKMREIQCFSHTPFNVPEQINTRLGLEQRCTDQRECLLSKETQFIQLFSNIVLSSNDFERLQTDIKQMQQTLHATLNNSSVNLINQEMVQSTLLSYTIIQRKVFIFMQMLEKVSFSTQESCQREECRYLITKFHKLASLVLRRKSEIEGKMNAIEEAFHTTSELEASTTILDCLFHPNRNLTAEPMQIAESSICVSKYLKETAEKLETGIDAVQQDLRQLSTGSFHTYSLRDLNDRLKNAHNRVRILSQDIEQQNTQLLLWQEEYSRYEMDLVDFDLVLAKVQLVLESSTRVDRHKVHHVTCYLICLRDLSASIESHKKKLSASNAYHNRGRNERCTTLLRRLKEVINDMEARRNVLQAFTLLRKKLVDQQQAFADQIDQNLSFKLVNVSAPNLSEDLVTLNELTHQIAPLSENKKLNPPEVVWQVEKIQQNMNQMAELCDHLSNDQPLEKCIVSKHERICSQLQNTITLFQSCGAGDQDPLLELIFSLQTYADDLIQFENKDYLEGWDAAVETIQDRCRNSSQQPNSVQLNWKEMPAAYLPYLEALNHNISQPLPTNYDDLLEFSSMLTAQRFVFLLQQTYFSYLTSERYLTHLPVNVSEEISHHLSIVEESIRSLDKKQSSASVILRMCDLHNRNLERVKQFLYYLHFKVTFVWTTVQWCQLERTITQLESIISQSGHMETFTQRISRLNEIICSFYEGRNAPVDERIPSQLNHDTHKVIHLIRSRIDSLKKTHALWSQYRECEKSINEQLEKGLRKLSSQVATTAELVELSHEVASTIKQLSSLDNDFIKIRTLARQLASSSSDKEVNIMNDRIESQFDLYTLIMSRYRVQTFMNSNVSELLKSYYIKLNSLVVWAESMETCPIFEPKRELNVVLRELQIELLPEANSKHEIVSFMSAQAQIWTEWLTKKQKKELSKKLRTTQKSVSNAVTWLASNEQKLLKLDADKKKAKHATLEVDNWLTLMEQVNSSQITFRFNANEYKRLMEDEDKIFNDIDSHTEMIYSVLEACRLVVNGCSQFETDEQIEYIARLEACLETRWNHIGEVAEQRRTILESSWNNYQTTILQIDDLNHWLSDMEKNSNTIQSNISLLEYEQIQNYTNQVSQLQAKSSNHYEVLDTINTHYRSLSQSPSKLVILSQTDESEDAVRSVNYRYHAFDAFLYGLQKRLNFNYRYKAQFDNFMNDVKNSLILFLEKKQKCKKDETSELMPLYVTINAQLYLFQRALMEFYQRSCATDCHNYEVLLTEYNQFRVEFEGYRESLLSKHDDGLYPMTEQVQVQSLTSHTSSVTETTSHDSEFEKAFSDTEHLLSELEKALNSDEGSEEDLDSQCYQFTKQLATGRCSVDLVCSLAEKRTDETTKNLKQTVAEKLETLSKLVESKLHILQTKREKSGLDCPLCSEQNWYQFQNDMWRLEQWLQHSEATQSEQKTVPRGIEHLAETTERHREFLMDLDGHKPVHISLNVVGSHLAEHCKDQLRSVMVRKQLKSMNERWQMICVAVTLWQSKLRESLINTSKFHKLLEGFIEWEASTSEYLTLARTVGTDEASIKKTARMLTELKADIQLHEPRVTSLFQMTRVLIQGGEDAYWNSLLETLRLLDSKLKILQRQCRLQLDQLYAVISADESLSLEYVQLCSTSNLNSNSTSSELISVQNETPSENDSALTWTRRFLSRVVRTALPIQAAMLLLLGIAYLVPTSEDDYSCLLSNNFARSLNPMLRHDGPPPF